MIDNRPIVQRVADEVKWLHAVADDITADEYPMKSSDAQANSDFAFNLRHCACVIDDARRALAAAAVAGSLARGVAVASGDTPYSFMRQRNEAGWEAIGILEVLLADAAIPPYAREQVEAVVSKFNGAGKSTRRVTEQTT